MSFMIESDKCNVANYEDVIGFVDRCATCVLIMNHMQRLLPASVNDRNNMSQVKDMFSFYTEVYNESWQSYNHMTLSNRQINNLNFLHLLTIKDI